MTGHPDPLSLLASADPVLARNKRQAFDFWRSVVNGGHVELADELLAGNKRLVFDMWRQLVDAGREEVADLYLAARYARRRIGCGL